jgi:hypothetical protein
MTRDQERLSKWQREAVAAEQMSPIRSDDVMGLRLGDIEERAI